MIHIWKDINQLATLEGAIKKDGRHLLPEDLSIIDDAAVVFDDDHLYFAGKSSELPSEYQKAAISKRGHVVAPELVDSHTHLVFAGNRADEYAMRLNGADYQAIAKAGGGILSTMRATKDASEAELFETACERIERIHSYGVGTIEIKSGYALTLAGEAKLTRVIERLKEMYAPQVRIYNTFMAAHAVPKGYANSAAYMSEVVLPLLNDLASENIVDAVDIFHEGGYFDARDVRALFDQAQTLGLKLKMHADEFQDNGGATLAAEYGALSADHLLCTGAQGIKDLAASSTVATLLPGTGYFLGKPQANARALLDAGAKVAIASDYNPGSCHVDNVLLLASLAAPNYKMNLCELWCGITHNAAHALGIENHTRFSAFKANTLSELTYSWGRNFKA